MHFIALEREEGSRIHEGWGFTMFSLLQTRTRTTRIFGAANHSHTNPNTALLIQQAYAELRNER